MASDEYKKNRIMDYAFKKFSTAGITQVTMDDVARGLGMGKGTLYKYFPSKESLLSNTIDFFASNMEKTIEEIFKDEKTTPEHKLGLFLKTMTEKISSVNPSVLVYMERSMPEVYEKLTKTRERIIMKNLLRVFEEGKKSGIFKPDLDEQLVAHMLIGSINELSKADVLSALNYSFDRIFNEVIRTIFQGCMTEKGRRLN